mgnify:CR=1 FL=1
MKVKDAMHEGAALVAPSTLLPELAERMRTDDVGALPVGENGKLLGMVTDRDIVVRGLGAKADPLQLAAEDVMTKPLIFCTTEEDLEDAVRLMESHCVRRLPVIDGEQRLVGMLSLGDIAANASASLVAETLRAVTAHHA